MKQLALHLLLRTDTSPSDAASLLGTAGYLVSKVNDDAIAEQIAGAPHIDGVVVELRALATVTFVRRIKALYGDNIVVVVISSAVDAISRAIAGTRVVKTEEIDDDLVSIVDLALASHHMRRTG